MLNKIFHMFSFRNISLSKQLSLFFVLVFLIPTVAMGSFFYLIVQNAIQQDRTEMNYLASLHMGRVQAVLNEMSTASSLAEQNPKELNSLREIQLDFEKLSKTGQMRFFVVGDDKSIKLISPSRFASQNRYGENIIHMLQRVLDQDQQINRVIEDDRGKNVFVTVRYFAPNKIGYFLQKDVEETISPLTGFRDIFLACLGLIGIILMFLVFFAVRYITNPIKEITEVAKGIERGELQRQSEVVGTNEIGTLAHAFNTMSKELIRANSVLGQKVKEKTAKLQNALQVVHAQKIQDDALLSSISEGMIALDQDGRVLLMNNAAEQLFNIHPRDVVGKQITDVVLLENTKQECVTQENHPGLLAMKTQQKVRTTDLSFVDEGKRISLEISAAPIILREKMIGSILILTDITKEKEIDRMKTEFISIASHQLRGPLASLKWYGDWFAKGKAGKLLKTQKEFIDKMNISTSTMISLVDDFLNVSRIEQGSIKNEPTDVVIADLVKNILSVSEHDVEEKKLTVQVENTSTVKVIHVDPDMIREIVANFISNAIKYTPASGFINILVSNDEKNLAVVVENTGYGIPVLEQEKIFSKFYRASNIVKQGLKGTGLGLYTSKRLAESMGGTVGFESVENETTKFWVYLPIS